jgi:hypothetical protein
MVEWEDYHGIDIAKHGFDNSEWLVYADKKLGGGEHDPYQERVDTLEEAKEMGLDLKNSAHPEDASVTLGYVEITEVERE